MPTTPSTCCAGPPACASSSPAGSSPRSEPRVTTTLYRGGRVYSTADPFATALVVEGDADRLGRIGRRRRRPRRWCRRSRRSRRRLRHPGLRGRPRPCDVDRSAPVRSRPVEGGQHSLRRSISSKRHGRKVRGRRRSRTRVGRDSLAGGASTPSRRARPRFVRRCRLPLARRRALVRRVVGADGVGARGEARRRDSQPTGG